MGDIFGSAMSAWRARQAQEAEAQRQRCKAILLERRAEFEDGALGEWVTAGRLSPYCNVHGRKWRTMAGHTGVIGCDIGGHPIGLPPPGSVGIEWFFPEGRAEKRPLA